VKRDPRGAGPGALVQFTPRSIGVLAGLVLVLGVGSVTVAARNGRDRAGDVLIHAVRVDGNGERVFVPPSPSSVPRGQSAPPPTPAPTPMPPVSVFETHQIVAYYGNPYSETMGILGEYKGEELIRRVKAQAAKYQALNPDKTVVPALHLVYAVCQGSPGPDGSYLIHMPDEMVEEFIELTRANGMLFFLDLQNGRKDPVAEAASVQHWLRNEHVHLAVDPEFTLAPNENPQDDIGEIDGEMVNKIQDLLQQTALDANIGNKVLVVHQFRPDMITNKFAIAKRERVDVVIDMDGWGTTEAKLSKYESHITNEPLTPPQYAGIKLFYRWDKPMLTEAQVQALTPRPNYIQYQ
jgi:hypothetical protein